MTLLSTSRSPSRTFLRVFMGTVSARVSAERKDPCGHVLLHVSRQRLVALRMLEGLQRLGTTAQGFERDPEPGPPCTLLGVECQQLAVHLDGLLVLAEALENAGHQGVIIGILADRRTRPRQHLQRRIGLALV